MKSSVSWWITDIVCHVTIKNETLCITYFCCWTNCCPMYAIFFRDIDTGRFTVAKRSLKSSTMTYDLVSVSHSKCLLLDIATYLWKLVNYSYPTSPPVSSTPNKDDPNGSSPQYFVWRNDSNRTVTGVSEADRQRQMRQNCYYV